MKVTYSLSKAEEDALLKKIRESRTELGFGFITINVLLSAQEFICRAFGRDLMAKGP